MDFSGRRVVVTSAGRGFGRAVAKRFAELGAEVIVSARSLKAARQTGDEIERRTGRPVRALRCDLADPVSVQEFTTGVADLTDRVDVLVNNGARWLEGNLLEAEDYEITETISSGATGTILVTKGLLPLLLASAGADIVTIISTCGTPGAASSQAHDAFYAAKTAQAGFTEILSKRLRAQGVRVISMYPPDFAGADPFEDSWSRQDRTHHGPLTTQSLTECVLFAVSQPRDCFIKSIHFEEPSPS